MSFTAAFTSASVIGFDAPGPAVPEPVSPEQPTAAVKPTANKQQRMTPPGSNSLNNPRYRDFAGVTRKLALILARLPTSAAPARSEGRHGSGNEGRLCVKGWHGWDFRSH